MYLLATQNVKKKDNGLLSTFADIKTELKRTHFKKPTQVVIFTIFPHFPRSHVQHRTQTPLKENQLIK